MLISNYRSRLSGPLLDRFDLQVELEPVPLHDLRRDENGETSRDVAQRVAAARLRQGDRNAEAGARTNAALKGTQLRRYVALDTAATRILAVAMRRLGLSARAHDAVLRVARSIADLAGCEKVGSTHVAEAVQYRAMDRPAECD